MAISSKPGGRMQAHKPAPAPPPPPAPATTSTKKLIREKSLLPRTACARLLGVSPATVATYQRQGLLAAMQLDGVYYSSRPDVLKLMAQREQENALVKGRDHRAVSDAARAGALAKTAFELLGSGFPALELVTRLGCTPDEARQLAKDYAELRDMGTSSKAADLVPCIKGCGNAARVCAACAGAS